MSMMDGLGLGTEDPKPVAVRPHLVRMSVEDDR